MDMTELPGVEIARLIKNREISATEVLEATLYRIDEVDRYCNAFVNLDIPSARAQARPADQMLVRGPVGNLPELHGVPFTVKDCIDTAGMPSTYGSRAFADCFPDWMQKTDRYFPAWVGHPCHPLTGCVVLPLRRVRLPRYW